jgi:acetyl-CoA carboxylase biotin carboxyl carrier protein
LNGPSQKVTNLETRHKIQPRTILDLKQIKQIIELMTRAELSEFAVEDEGFKLKIRRGANNPSSNGKNSSPPFVVASSPTTAPIPTVQSAPTQPVAAESVDDVGIIYIKSPMVGTFYRSPSPESKTFAETGTKVSESSPVCIIEAMKIMNEIQSEVKGTILEALVENGDPVEYGQRLFKVKAG